MGGDVNGRSVSENSTELPEEEKIKAIEKLGAFKESFTGLFSFTDKQKEEIVKCCDGIIASLEE